MIRRALSFASSEGWRGVRSPGALPVDRVEVTVVIENFLDVLMAGEEGVVRYRARDFKPAEHLVAEHGFAAAVALERNGDRLAALDDARLTPDAVARTLDVLEVPVGDCARSSSRIAMVTTTAACRDCPPDGALVTAAGDSPDAWRERRSCFHGPASCACRRRVATTWRPRGCRWSRSARKPLVDDSVLVSGQIERVTEFEGGLPIDEARGVDGWEPDPYDLGRSGARRHVLNRGLLVVSGCRMRVRSTSCETPSA